MVNHYRYFTPEAKDPLIEWLYWYAKKTPKEKTVHVVAIEIARRWGEFSTKPKPKFLAGILDELGGRKRMLTPKGKKPYVIVELETVDIIHMYVTRKEHIEK